MDDAQLALCLIDSIERLSESTVEFIHSTVMPLTQRKVSKYLCDYDTRHNFSTLSSASISEANSSTVPIKSKRFECTKAVCKGPHPSVVGPNQSISEKGTIFWLEDALKDPSPLSIKQQCSYRSPCQRNEESDTFSQHDH